MRALGQGFNSPRLHQQRDAAHNIAIHFDGLRYFLCPKERRVENVLQKYHVNTWNLFYRIGNGGVRPGASAAKAEERPKGAEARERGQKADKVRGGTPLASTRSM